eukprot:scaffold217200_cov19-Prasinocladus_malaysianus.AAC.1
MFCTGNSVPTHERLQGLAWLISALEYTIPMRRIALVSQARFESMRHTAIHSEPLILILPKLGHGFDS